MSDKPRSGASGRRPASETPATIMLELTAQDVEALETDIRYAMAQSLLGRLWETNVKLLARIEIAAAALSTDKDPSPEDGRRSKEESKP